MKVTVKKKEDSTEYPCIMESKDSMLILLFEKEREGTVLDERETGYRRGYHAASWDMSSFKPFEGKIILSN